MITIILHNLFSFFINTNIDICSFIVIFLKQAYSFLCDSLHISLNSITLTFFKTFEISYLYEKNDAVILTLNQVL